MKHKYLLKAFFALSIGLMMGTSWGQVTTIDFETVGAGYSSSATNGTGNIDTFNRVNVGVNGNTTFYWVAEDLLANATIDLAQIDVTGSDSFTFAVDMSYANAAAWDSTDELLITYSIDGGPYNNLMAVQNITTTDLYNNAAALDLDFDGNGDPGQELSTTAFVTYTTASIPLSSNSTLDIKFQFNTLSSNGEGIFLDNIVVTESVASTDPTVTFDTTSSNVNETNATFNTTIPVTFTNYTAPVTIGISVNGSSTAEVEDYTLNTAALVFNANGTQNISLDINPDVDFDDETIILDISITSGTATIANGQHTVTVTDDETPPAPDLIISEVADPSDNYLGRFVEIYNNGAISIDLAAQQIFFVKQVNGGSFYRTALTGIIEPNTVYIIGNNTNVNNVYGFNATINSNYADGNGDDGYFLYFGGDETTGVLFDSYGVIGQDGSSQAWEYLDSRAYRTLPKSTSPNATWTASEWTVEATSKNVVDMTPGALEGEFRYDGSWKPRDIYTNITATDNIYISSNIALTGNITANDLEVKSGVDFAINSGKSLILNGTSTGDIIYKRNLATTNWYLVGVPVAGALIESFITNHPLATNAGGEYSLATYDNNWTGATTGWSYADASSSGAILPGMGFSTKITVAGDLSFKGTYPSGNININLSQGSVNNFNLIGNPYPAYINSATFLTTNSANLVSETIWLWDQSTSSYITKVTADAFKIAPAQGFFVETGVNGNVTFETATQSHEVTDTFMRTVNNRPEIHLTLTDGATTRLAKIYYIDGTTTSFDNGFDGELFGDGDNSFAVYSQLVTNNVGKNYQIQSLPNSNYENMVIPIGVNATAGTTLTFTAETMNIPSGYMVFLEDRANNAYTRLDEINTNYQVTLATDSNGIGRFYLHTSTERLKVDNVALQNISVYTKNNHLVMAGLPQGNTQVQLFSILGKSVLQTSFNTDGFKEITLPSLSKGVYIVQLGTEKGKLNKKVIIE